MTLEIVSGGLYALEIEFNARFHQDLVKLNWCYEAGKGLVFATDLTGEIPRKLGFKTGRVYLRDYIMYLAGYWENGKATAIWHRKSIPDYKLAV